jgi:hypothetical protein
MLAKIALLCYNNYSDKERVIICVLKGILDVCFSVKSTQKATTIFVRRLPLLLCFSPFLSTILLAFCYAVRFLIYIRRRNYRLKIRQREPTVFIRLSLRLRLVSRQMKTLYHSFSSFFKENGSYHFTTQGKISNGQ